MPRIEGEHPQSRKVCLAELVVQHLRGLGIGAQLLRNRQNAAGHTDRVVVDSARGLIHVMALSGPNPNEPLPYQQLEQRWLADKAYVAIGWNSGPGRTLVFFVEAERLAGRADLTKAIVRQLSDGGLNADWRYG